MKGYFLREIGWAFALTMVLVFFLILSMIVLGSVAEGQNKTPPRPPWVVVERKVICNISDSGLPQYSIKGRTLWDQRWTIFTNSTSDFDSVSIGLVYRCTEDWDGDRWCPDGMVVQMSRTYLPEAHK